MRLSEINKGIIDLKHFRSSMRGQLDAQHVFRIWGRSKDVLKIIKDNEIPEKWEGSEASKRKLYKAREELLILREVPFIRFIGVSGSVSAGIAKENDDIDIFLVSMDHTAWLVRGIVKIVLGNKAVWYGDTHQKDKYCINMIVEERSTRFREHDIFTFNELVYLESLYGSLSKERLLGSNSDLLEKFGARISPSHLTDPSYSKLSILLFPFEFIAYLAQVSYMIILGHKPEIWRLLKGFLSGRIEFYPSQFRHEKLRDFDITKPTRSFK